MSTNSADSIVNSVTELADDYALNALNDITDDYVLNELDSSTQGMNPNAVDFIPTTSKAANASKRKKRKKKSNKRKHLKIYSQNVHGIFESKKDKWGKPIKGKRSYAKLEFLVNKMREDDIDTYLLQETWDEGDWVKDIHGYTIFHHNDIQKSSRTGVTIILSPRFSKAWKLAGGLDPLKTERGGLFKGRFIGITLKFPKTDLKGKALRGNGKNSPSISLSSLRHNL